MSKRKPNIIQISPLSSGDVSKYKVLISKDVLLGKELRERAGTIKRIKYSPLGKEMNKKQYQKLDSTYEYDRRKKKNKQLKI